MFYVLNFLFASPLIVSLTPIVSLFWPKFWSPLKREKSGSRAVGQLKYIFLVWQYCAVLYMSCTRVRVASIT